MIKQAFDTVSFVGEANTFTSKSETYFKKKGIELMMRHMLPSAGSVQHPVFIIGGYHEILKELQDMNIELWQRIKLNWSLYFKSFTCRLIKGHIKLASKIEICFPFGVGDLLAECFFLYSKKCKIGFKCFAI